MGEDPGRKDGGAGPQYSPDGKWWWDGQQWNPASQAETPPGSAEAGEAREKPRVARLSRRQKIVGGGGVSTVLAAGIGLVTVLYQQGVLGPHVVPTPTAQTTGQQVAASPVASASPSSASATWNAVLNDSRNTSSLNGYVPISSSDHFLVVDLTFENTTSSAQVLNDRILDLQDSAGQHYSEDQASNPDQSFVVQAGESIQVSLAYVVPDPVCHFELDVVDSGAVQKSWTITSSYPGCGS